MDKKKKSLLFQTQKQMNLGSIASGTGFLLYLGARAMKLEVVAGLIAIAFTVVAAWTFFSVIDGREKDKETFSYNLLWGSGALAIMLGACAVLTIRQWLGL